MTAKEKAVQLRDLFTDFGQAHTQFPIDAAINCVDELIKELVLLQINESHDAWVAERVNWLEEVKLELHNT